MKLFRYILIFFYLSLILPSCNQESENIFFKEVGTLLWVNESMPDSAVKLAVKETIENSTLIISQITWSSEDSSFIKNAQWYKNLSMESGKAFMLNIDWLENDRSGMRDNCDFENERTRALFIKDVKKLVDLYQPNYITLGVEVNYYALTNPLGYKEFIKLFNELKTSIKTKDSKIKVGLSFQLELLYGIHDKWKPNKTLEPLNAVVENLDYIGISTYPEVLIRSNNEHLLSINYLDSITVKYIKPIGISETGISSFNNKNNERVKYINELYKKAGDLNLSFIIWGSIIDDPRSNDWKGRLGLISSDGTYKAEYNIWKNENKKFIKN